VACGYWPLYSFDPRNHEQPFQLASRKPAGDFKEFAMKEARFAMLARAKPQEHERLMALGKGDIDARWQLYEQLAAVTRGPAVEGGDGNGANKAQTAKEVEA
jgi:pyruvate-ferredoxin/flavodoxin oxidoreductase